MADVHEVKLCLLGDTFVGKSSIVHRYVYDSFNPTMDCTVGAAFYSKTVKVNDFFIKYQIWDTAGQERYRALVPLYYKDATAAIIVYDMTNKSTFMSVKTWINELQQHGNTDCTIVIVGNKNDLTSLRQVDQAEAAALAANHSALFLETSAKTAENIKELFVELSNRLSSLKHAEWAASTRNDNVHRLDMDLPGRSYCCQR